MTPRHLTRRALASALVLVSCAGIARASAPRADVATAPGAVGRAALAGGVEGIRRALEIVAGITHPGESLLFVWLATLDYDLRAKQTVWDATRARQTMRELRER